MCWRSVRPGMMMALAAGLTAAAAWSATSTSHFSVRVVVSQETCTSETVSLRNPAVVQVDCSSSNFVNIAPLRARPLAGSSGGAFRSTSMSPPAVLAGFAPIATSDGTSAQAAIGTVTSFQVVANSATDNLYELLISF